MNYTYEAVDHYKHGVGPWQLLVLTVPQSYILLSAQYPLVFH